MYDQRQTAGSTGLGRHQTRVADADRLSERTLELINIFARMPVTDRDRATPAYQGMTGLCPNSPERVTQWYLQEAAEKAITRAIRIGLLPIWVAGEAEPLDERTYFGPNQWQALYTIRSGVYLAINIMGPGDSRRAVCNDVPLWVKNKDWLAVRNRLVADHEQASGTRLNDEFRLWLGLDAEETPAPSLSMASGCRPRGRRPVYDWNAMVGELMRIADEDGLDEWFPNQAAVEGWAANWFIQRQGKSPGTSTIRERISPIYQARADNNRRKAGK